MRRPRGFATTPAALVLAAALLAAQAAAAQAAAGVQGVASAQPAAGAQPARACELRGEAVQWIADYCMLRMHTDDEIAVSGCIAEHLRATPADECATRRRFKRAMCGMAMMGDGAKGVERCVRDPDFMGRTVRRGGVGG